MNSTYAQKSSTAQKAADTKAASVLDSSAQNESLQRKADMANNAAQRVEAPRPNNTGMPDDLKAGIESLSGFSMDDVRVHYNSSKPATVQALAYTQGTDIHVAPGQEKCLPHEAWHVAQQMAGRVSPTTNINGMPVNDNAALEHEADVMGEKAVQCKVVRNAQMKFSGLCHSNEFVTQRIKISDDEGKNITEIRKFAETERMDPTAKYGKYCGDRTLGEKKLTLHRDHIIPHNTIMEFLDCVSEENEKVKGEKISNGWVSSAVNNFNNFLKADEDEYEYKKLEAEKEEKLEVDKKGNDGEKLGEHRKETLLDVGGSEKGEKEISYQRNVFFISDNNGLSYKTNPIEWISGTKNFVSKDEFEVIEKATGWMPGNIFLAPCPKMGEPGDGFDDTCACAAQNGDDGKYFIEKHKTAYYNMQAFVKYRTVKNAEKAVELLAEIAEKDTFWEFNQENWLFDDIGVAYPKYLCDDNAIINNPEDSTPFINNVGNLFEKRIRSSSPQNINLADNSGVPKKDRYPYFRNAVDDVDKLIGLRKQNEDKISTLKKNGKISKQSISNLEKEIKVNTQKRVEFAIKMAKLKEKNSIDKQKCLYLKNENKEIDNRLKELETHEESNRETTSVNETEDYGFGGFDDLFD